MSYQALLFCPDDKTARVVRQVLTELDFTVEICNEPFAAVKKLMAQHFDAIVVDCENEQNAALLFKSARNSNTNQNSLSVAVVEGQAGVAKAFRIGANLVLTKPINVEQSKGTLRVARGLLRKAESAKPAFPVPATPEVSPKPAPIQSPQTYTAAPSASFSKPVAAALTPQAPLAPLTPANVAGLEVEPEPVPEPEPTEAAMLESMHDPVPSAGQVSSQPALGNRAPYPWQPVSKAAEPMASALKRAAEAATKGPELENISHTAPNLSMGPARTGQGLAFSGMASGGAASAPAPAKQLVPTADSVAPAKGSAFAIDSEMRAEKRAVVEPPAFAALAVKDHEEIDTGSRPSRKPLVFAALVIVLAAAGYLGWTRYHAVLASLFAGSPSAHSATPAAQPSIEQPAQIQTSPTAPQPQPTVIQAQPSESPAPSTFTPKLSAGIKVSQPEVAPDVTTRVSPAQGSSHAIVVKTSPSAAHASVPSQEIPAPAAPPIVGVADASASNQIAGIVSPDSVPMPKAAPQSLRISQGVSQGLIVKRVSPAYPQQALQMRVQGAVLLEAVISKTGAVKNVKTLKGDPILARAAVDAVRQWKYKPYFLDGEPVEIQTDITVNFKLP